MGRLVLRGGAGGAADGMESCTMVAGGIVDGTRGGAIREPSNALGDKGGEMRGVETGMDTSNMMVARSIK